METMQRLEKTQETAPRTRARGHLSLVEWSGETGEQAPQADVPELTDPFRRTGADRFYTGGILLLMAAIALAVAASFARL